MAEHIPIGSDHAGFEMKGHLARLLEKMGYTVEDLGTHTAESTDYADFAHPVAREVSTGEAKRGILLCGTGLGMSYAANRWPHVRAAVAWSPEVAKLSREHNDANILVLPSRYISDEESERIVEAWLNTPFDGGRHERRIAKIERADGEGES